MFIWTLFMRNCTKGNLVIKESKPYILLFMKSCFSFPLRYLLLERRSSSDVAARSNSDKPHGRSAEPYGCHAGSHAHAHADADADAHAITHADADASPHAAPDSLLHPRPRHPLLREAPSRRRGSRNRCRDGAVCAEARQGTGRHIQDRRALAPDRQGHREGRVPHTEDSRRHQSNHQDR